MKKKETVKRNVQKEPEKEKEDRGLERTERKRRKKWIMRKKRKCRKNRINKTKMKRICERKGKKIELKEKEREKEEK